jgi:hypothetical protein
MKKLFLALLVAGLFVACGNKKEQPAEVAPVDSTAIEAVVDSVPPVAVAAPETKPAVSKPAAKPEAAKTEAKTEAPKAVKVDAKDGKVSAASKKIEADATAPADATAKPVKTGRR